MLCLSRRPTERILIAQGSIVVTVVRIAGDRVTIGIDADDSVDVLREELALRLAAEQKKKQSDSAA